MDIYSFYMIVAGLFGFFMAWGIGANDVSNAMGPSVGSGALSMKQAVCIAAIFEFLGTMLAGGSVTATIRSSIINPHLYIQTPLVFVHGMLAALLAAGCWLLFASKKGWPVSTTHTIVGALIGFGLVTKGFGSVQWICLLNIVSCWILSPIIGGILAFLLASSVKLWIIDQTNPIEQAKRYLPLYVFLMCFIMSMVTLIKGLDNLHIDLSFLSASLYSALLSFIVMLIAYYRLSKMYEVSKDRSMVLARVEKTFASLMIFMACAMAFAHGSNDVSNAIGPLAAIYGIILNHGMMHSDAIVPFWILLVGGIGIVAGLMMFGKKVILTVGSEITALSPSSGFCVSLATASTVIICTGLALPISTTQTLIGAVIGVALAHGTKALHFETIKKIIHSWIITLPAGALMAILFYALLHGFFDGLLHAKL